MRKLIALLTTMLATTASAQGVIDVHAHLLPAEFVEALESEGRLMDEGFPLPRYDVEEHLKWMDEAGVETSILTLAAPQPAHPQETRPRPLPGGRGEVTLSSGDATKRRLN